MNVDYYRSRGPIRIGFLFKNRGGRDLMMKRR